jgi:prepilin-type N-terminal cleavage/methylation domain-containing protein
MHGTRHNLNQRPGSRGFTIVELLSSLFVIGLILAILIVGLRYFFAAGQSTKQRAAVAQMKQAVADFRSKFGYLPPLVMDQYVAPTPLPGGMAAAGLAQSEREEVAGAIGAVPASRSWKIRADRVVDSELRWRTTSTRIRGLACGRCRIT